MEDSFLIDVYARMLQTFGCSVDCILTTPEYREMFLAEARQTVVDAPERERLRRLVNLRKRSKLPRTRDNSVASGEAQA